MFKRLLIAFASVCSFMSAEPRDLDQYRIYVTAIDDENHTIAISNGLVCHVIEKDWGVEKNLEVGEEIELSSGAWDLKRNEAKKVKLILHFKPGRYYSTEQCIVWVDEESKRQCLTYVSGNTVCVQPAGWFSGSRYKGTIELSDGSKWELKKQISAEPFSKGERVILSRDLTMDDWILLNLDRTAVWSRHNTENPVCFNAYLVIMPFVDLPGF